MIPVPTRRLLAWGVGLAVVAFAVLVFPGALAVLLTADLLLAGAALLDLALTPGRKTLDVTRSVPERMSVLGEQVVTLTVRNRSAFPLRIRLQDTVPAELRPDREEVAVTAPARGEARAEYRVTPAARGRFAWGPIHLRYRTLLGLWERRKTIPAAAETHVYPNLAALQRYYLLAQTHQLASMGIRKVRLRGGAWEFESLRDYVPGDDVRLIDWKATARRRKPITRNQEAERNQTVLLLIDSGRLMNAEVDGVAKLDHAVNAALVLAHIALARGDRVGLCTFSHKVHGWVPPRPHVGQNRVLAEAVYDLHGDFTETDHGRCLRLLRARYPRRALLVVLTDFVDADTAADMMAHLHLATRRHLVLFVALRDRFLEKAARARPELPRDAFRKAAAVELLHERRTVLERIRQQGAHVLDADPADVTAPLINRYLEVTFRGLL